MGRRIVILKTGSTFEELARERGDYEDWIATGLGLGRAGVRVVNAEAGEALPPLGEVGALIVTGSAAMVTDRPPWSVRSAELLAEVVRAGRPTLAICYGHQLLADALGGHVGDNPNGRQVGTIEVTLTAAGKADPLLGPTSPRSRFQASHRQAVLALPPSAVHLATSPRDDNHAYRIGPRAWSVQFHPEFDAAVSRAYIERRRIIIRDEGHDPDALLDDLRETPAGPSLLERFAGLT
ncbi:MAG: glutamine amidotransferase [Deltaproteobacteria bacterium]|nr:MAG: glutamine amidotransferase [Deltaproteobacteria bacterium]